MDIIIRKAYKNVKEFSLVNLPDFIVLTGENGTGKTQFLNYLYQASRLDDEGNYVNMSDGEDVSFDIPEGERIIEGPLGDYKHPAIVLCDGNRVTNSVLRGVQAPTVEVGGKYDWKKLYSGGENIAAKHLFYKTHSTIGNMDEINLDELSSSFNSMLGLKKHTRGNSDAIYPELTKQDIDIIKRIDEEIPHLDYLKDPFYYIAFQPAPKTNVFAANLKFLYVQYWARKQAELPVGKAPWEAFNEMGEMLNFKFELDEPKIDEKKFDVRLRDKSRKVFISPESLSSGEKVIFSLFVAMYTTHSSEHLPNLILFDEPDAYLHPSLCGTMLKVMQDVFISQHNIKVIMTTHNPTTVAMVPETSIYKMNDGKMHKCTKKDAILSLTSGLNTISVYYENVKQVFVEADNDNYFLTQIYHLAMSSGKLVKDVNLRFVNVGNDKNGGCTIVKKIVNDLSGADNKTVYGIIDWDGKNGASDRIKVLGGGKRYAIDNYLIDPLAVSLLYLEEPAERTKIGFSEHDSLVGFSKKTQVEKQRIIDNVIGKLATKVPEDKRTDVTSVDYTVISGEVYQVPVWFVNTRGHDLVEYMKEAAPFLKKYDDNKLFKKVIETCYNNYPEIIPMDLVDTMVELQNIK